MTQSLTAISPFTPDLWVLHSRTMAYNAGAWISNGQALLIDPGVFADEIDLLAQTVKGQGAEPSAVLLTHSHWDHVLGPERLPGVRVLAHERAVGLMAEYEQLIRREIAQWEKAKEVKRLTTFTMPKVDQTFAESGDIQIGDLNLQLIHVPGHAADQLAVFEAASGTLWASDLLSDDEIPFVSDRLIAYEQTLAHLAALDIRALVPGHGTFTTDANEIRARITDDRAYLAELHERVGATVRVGQSVEAAVAACASMHYRLKDRMTLYQRLNVESIYLELGGPGDPKQIGWERDWEKYPASKS